LALPLSGDREVAPKFPEPSIDVLLRFTKGICHEQANLGHRWRVLSSPVEPAVKHT
jgi:hypothetical protein